MCSSDLNGAGMFPSQKWHPLLCKSCRPRCFNGAGMFPSQKFRLIERRRKAKNSLQWGRDVSIPEMALANVESSGVTQLQWGRDVSIPEMFAGSGVWLPDIQLQWGRDVSIPEIPQDFPLTRGNSRASMGPGCFHPRNGRPRIDTAEIG